MLELEHVGDKIVHDIVKRLNKTFVTPLDRQDIYDLASTLDDVLDSIEAAADMMLLYRIEAPTRQATEQAAVIAAQTALLKTAIDNLEGRSALDHQWIEVHRLENEGDRLYRDAVAGLFEGDMTGAEIIKWKDIYATLEQACDDCEDVANVIETIVMKKS
jgi:predicted phosphate transport protein (TIGR00153 family)